jgi:phage shock protein C
MNMRGKRFEVDREEGKLLGVCAGLANLTGIDATIIRIGFVVATLFHGFPWTLIAYGVLALVGQRRTRDHGDLPIDRDADSPERLRALDLRMRAIETHAAGANSALAREIDALR